MSKLNDLRIALAKMISGLNEAVLEDGTKIAYESLEMGAEVYLVTENGEYADIPDGEYKIGENDIYIVDGRIAELPANEIQANEIQVESVSRNEIDELYARLDAFEQAVNERLAALEDKSVAKPAEEEIEEVIAPKDDLRAVFKKCKKFN